MKNVLARDLTGQVLRLRRMYYGIFNPAHISQAIQATRAGECHRCGLCCQLVYKCPFLGRDSTNLPYCRIYGDLRPTNCHTYPFDWKDAEIDTCGFSFKKPEDASQGAK